MLILYNKNYKKINLINICKIFNIKKYSKLTKLKLLNLINEYKAVVYIQNLIRKNLTMKMMKCYVQ